MERTNYIQGIITSRFGQVPAGLIVRAYDMGVRRAALLSEAVTDAQGAYKISWRRPADRQGEPPAVNIGLKVLTPKETILFSAGEDDVRYNAGRIEEINVVLVKPIPRETIEYDDLTASLAAAGLAPGQLEENDNHRDITMVARTTSIPAEKLGHLALAGRLEELAKIEAPFFYALLRQNTLLKDDLAKPFGLRLHIGANTEPKEVLYDAVLADSKTITRDITQAAEAKLISEATAKSTSRHLKSLARFKAEAETYVTEERVKRFTELATQFVLEDKIGEAARLFKSNKHDLTGVIKQVSNIKFLGKLSKVKNLQTTLALGELVGYDQAIITQVAKAHAIKKPEHIRRLARLDKKAWTAELTKSKVTAGGKPLTKNLVGLHASSLARKLEKTYPTQAFAAQLERETKPLLSRHQDVSALLNKYEDFDLQNSNIDLFFKDKKLTAARNQPLREELKQVQRVFRFAPHYGKATALLKHNIASARDVTTMGKTRFIKQVAPAAGLSSKEAQAMYAKAEATSTAAMIVAGELQDVSAAAPIPAFNTLKLAEKVAGVTADFPNLKSLFKAGDTCSCGHCRSVYGPAAYLVELLEFVDNRLVTDLTVTPHVTTNKAQDVLFARRPDLGEIDLSCANAMTPMPYIDLVSEQLEELIAPNPGIAYSGNLAGGSDPLVGTIAQTLLDALVAQGVPVTAKAQVFATETTGSSATLPRYIRDKKAVLKAVNTSGNNYKIFRLRQTLSPAEELAAAPEYVNAAAYTKLATSSYAFGLPFDLAHTEASAYFGRFDINRAELMRTFQVGITPSNETIDAESLGLTEAERTIITTPDVAGQKDYWNTSATPAATELKNVDTFLTKTGLTYDELVLLLTLQFIDPTDNLFIKHLDLSCDTAQKEIENLDDAALDRIHRFLRLQKQTDWKLETLDEVISQSGLGAGQLNDSTLQMAAQLLRLNQATGLKLDELIGGYGHLPHEEIDSRPGKPLYHQIFLNKAKNGVINEALLPEKINGSGFLADVAASLAVSLQVKDSELPTLFIQLVDNKLTFENLSYLFLLTRLMRKLKLRAADIDILIDLIGANPITSPANTLEFVQAAQAAKNQPLKLADIRYLLYHQADDITKLELKDETIQSVLKSLQTGYQQAYAATKSPFDPNLEASEQLEALSKQLAQFPQVTADDSKTITGFLRREWASPAAAKTLIDTLFADLFNTTGIKAAIDTLAAVPPASDTSLESRDLLKALMNAIAAYQFLAAKRTLLEAQISSAFKTDLDTTSVILARAILKQPAPGTDALQDILLSDSLIDTVNAAPAPPAISEAAFTQHYRALRLLHKLLPLVSSYELEPEVTDWVFAHNAELGWLEWDAIPYESGQVEAPYEKYTDLTRLLQLASQLPPVVNPADATRPITFWSVMEMVLPGTAATRAEFLEHLALLTGYDQAILDDIDAHFFPAFNFTEYHQVAVWERLMVASEYVRKLAGSVSDIVGYIKPTLITSDADALRRALKSRYDETTWLDTLKEIMDAIRPQKRDALVAYVLATRPEFKDTNSLYDHLLIDVEMEACMPSSRIVQAHNTIQLFVQRSLMGLEPEAAADTDTDSGWEQWKWLKLFRVREVNHKIFLYPENWIEAELRDEKSFIFTDMENELQQNELTEFTAERALTTYLERLDDLSFLEVVATWYQTSTKSMHVFARSKGGDPAIYYHRKFEQERAWTPWAKVELEITGDHLLAFERNNRLTLAWPIFSEQPDPNPQSTVPNQTPGTVVPSEKPKRKLKIQLAVSEYADNMWQPKRVSQDAIRTPGYYTNEDLQQPAYNLVYIEAMDKILVLKALGQDYTELRGTFDVAGCKGYPELDSEGQNYFPDFFPDFKDTILNIQRYLERNQDATNDLAARTALSPFNPYEILGQTPGNFRLTYPHQMTLIDWVALLLQYFLFAASSTRSAVGHEGRFKIPFGTLLPYFMEDSSHAYVIIPGFYEREKREGRDEDNITADNISTAVVKRTASNVLQLIEDIIALYKKYLAKLQGGQSLPSVIQELLADDDYHDIIAELKVYASLRYGEQFSNMYHPLICALRKTLYKEGIPALMRRQIQLQQTNFKFQPHYSPSGVVPQPYPIEDIDFNSDGSYSSYNWELFFHVPMLIATQLTRNQRFSEAMDWFHYIFNPTGALPGNAPQKYWVTKPFFLRNDNEYIEQRIDTLLYKIADPNTPEIKELEFAIQQWREKPFKPHVVARFRTVTYQKAILMKYIDNLVEWGDNLFRQDTMESVAQATQMYVLADKLLGPKPRIVPPVISPPDETYNQIQGKLGPLGNALIDLENILPDLSVLPEGGAELLPAPITLSTLYFCIPQNEQMLAYWDRIADRLFKIRHCQNIEGIERSLALFAPPIDPAMLVKAAAAGLDISSIIAGLNAPLPYYRFNVLSQKATDLANEVRSLGSSLLQALEKKDAEELALLRNEQEISVLNAVTNLKKLSIAEAKEQIEVLGRTRQATEERSKFYAEVEKINGKEQLNLDKLSDAHDLQIAAQISRTLAGVVAMVPDLLGGASGFGGSPHVTLQWGGKNLAAAANSAADVVNIFGTIATYEAGRAATLGGYDRRFDDWKLQERVTQKELASLDKQIAAAEIRQELAEQDLKNHELQIKNAKQTDEYMHSKFTNQELYQWMIGQISSIYFSSYKMAHDVAKKAERTYQFELGRDDSYIAFGYWDSLKKGLQTSDRLINDIKRMEVGYLDRNKREYEITKHLSLAALDPLALAKLRATGACDFDVPEAVLDLDHAGQLFRRTKSVSVSLPCLAGPHTSVSAKLSLISNKYRKNTNPDNLAGTGYAEDPGNDERFTYSVGAIQSIATSESQQDNGMFELNFKDERYLPFEGTGAISSWRLELPKKELAQFSYDTIADVVLHLNFTAREGGSGLRTLAETTLLDRLAELKQALSQTGLHTAINLKHEMPGDWHLLKSTGSIESVIGKNRLPYLAQALDATIENVVILAKITGNPAMFTLKLDGADLNLSRIDTWKLVKGETTDITLDTPVTISLTPPNLPKLEELMLVVKYGF